jgi:hypothetical protein
MVKVSQKTVAQIVMWMTLIFFSFIIVYSWISGSFWENFDSSGVSDKNIDIYNNLNTLINGSTLGKPNYAANIKISGNLFGNNKAFVSPTIADTITGYVTVPPVVASTSKTTLTTPAPAAAPTPTH